MNPGRRPKSPSNYRIGLDDRGVRERRWRLGTGGDRFRFILAELSKASARGILPADHRRDRSECLSPFSRNFASRPAPALAREINREKSGSSAGSLDVLASATRDRRGVRARDQRGGGDKISLGADE